MVYRQLGLEFDFLGGRSNYCLHHHVLTGFGACPKLLCERYRVIFAGTQQPENENYQMTALSVEVKNRWKYISTFLRF